MTNTIITKTNGEKYVIPAGSINIGTRDVPHLVNSSASAPTYNNLTTPAPQTTFQGGQMMPAYGTPQYQALLGNQGAQTNTPSQYQSLTNTQSTTPTKNPTTSFTESLIGILKNAKEVNQSGKAALMQQGQNITSQGLADAERVFKNPYLTPSMGTSLGLNTQDALSPLNLSIENQQKLASSNFSDTKDLAAIAQDAYDKEQSRIIDREKIVADASSAGLTPGQTQSALTQITNQFDNEPAVRNYQIVNEGYQFAKTLANKTNPTSADDQGLIYAFAKAMDPNSAVREGEYTTVQKYAQSMIQTGWANAKRFVGNVAFLTPEARKNMVDTINSKQQAAEASYQNIYKGYQQKIADAKSGQITGGLVDYSQAFNPTPSSTNETDKINQMKKDGLSDSVIEQVLGHPLAAASSGKTVNIAQKNNNPLNIKASSTTRAYPGVVAITDKAKDGGNFLSFDTPQSGFAAAKKLITSSLYSTLSVDQALKKWSANSYGGKIIPELSSKKINQLTPQELDTVIQKMARQEGYYT